MSALWKIPRLSIRASIFALITSTAWAYFLIARISASSYGVYSPARLLWGILLIPPLFLFLSYWLGSWIGPVVSGLSKRGRFFLLLGSSVAGICLCILLPAPVLLQSQNHSLQIITQLGAQSASIVQISDLRYLDGSRVPVENLKLSGNWRSSGEGWIATGKGTFTLELKGEMPLGVAVALVYQPAGGKVNIQWDGAAQEQQLISSQYLRNETVLKSSTWKGIPLPQAALNLGLLALYFWGMACFVGLVFLLARNWTAAPQQETALLGFLYGVLALGFIFLKLSILSFDTAGVYRDTFSYADAASLPLNSVAFWAGTRSFTLPLLYKLFGLNLQNYLQPARTEVLAHFQLGFSIASWLVLAGSFAQILHGRWIRLLAFGLILSFALSYEISKWDLGILSESLSFSSLALLLAGWVWLINLFERSGKTVAKAVLMVMIVIVTVLYSFTRDTNLYFVVMAAGLFFLAAFVFKANRSLRLPSAIYLAAVVLLFIAQNESIIIGNRWQIHIYDHLAHRIYNNEPVLEDFIRAGLPYSTRLVEILSLGGAKYYDQMMKDPEMEPVRQWVNENGKTAFLGYLLSHPRNTLLEPLKRLPLLINGTGLDYRFPLSPVRSVPSGLLSFSSITFPIFGSATGVLFGALFFGVSLYGLFRHNGSRAWLVVMILLASTVPLIYIVWFGNPLEVQRHSEQVAIQLRLAAWLAIPLIVDLPNRTNDNRTKTAKK